MVMFSGGNLNNITCSNDTSRNNRWPLVHVHVHLIQCFLSYSVSSSWSGECRSTRSDIMSLTTAAPAWRRPAQTLPSRKMWVALILTLDLLFLIQSGTNWWTATRTWPTPHTWQTAPRKSKPLFKVRSLELEKNVFNLEFRMCHPWKWGCRRPLLLLGKYQQQWVFIMSINNNNIKTITSTSKRQAYLSVIFQDPILSWFFWKICLRGGCEGVPGQQVHPEDGPNHEGHESVQAWSRWSRGVSQCFQSLQSCSERSTGVGFAFELANNTEVHFGQNRQRNSWFFLQFQSQASAGLHELRWKSWHSSAGEFVDNSI